MYINNISILTLTDRFSKFVVGYILTTRNSLDIRVGIRYLIGLTRRPENLTADNEFHMLIPKEYFQFKNIQIHFMKPNTHRGNADIERWHSTIQ